MSTLEKAGLDPKDLEGFNEETLDQLNMENIEGGQLDPDSQPKPLNRNNCGCPVPTDDFM